MRASLAARVSPGRHCRSAFPSLVREKATSVRARAWRSSHSRQRFTSVAGLFRNLRRAGTLLKRSRTSTTVPWCREEGSTPERSPKDTRITLLTTPPSSPCTAEAMLKSDTEAMLGKASPLKP